MWVHVGTCVVRVCSLMWVHVGVHVSMHEAGCSVWCWYSMRVLQLAQNIWVFVVLLNVRFNASTRKILNVVAFYLTTGDLPIRCTLYLP